MSHRHSARAVLWIGLLLASCANFRPHLAETDRPPDRDASEAPTYSVYLVGSTGADPSEDGRVLRVLNEHLRAAPERSAVLFLGDQLPRTGMPPKSEETARAAAQSVLDAQLAALDGYRGTPFFLPGDRDWKRYGVRGVQRQENYLEKRLNAGLADEDDWNNYFYPDNGCADPEIIELTDELSLLLLDSQWWLEDGDDPHANLGCEVQSHRRFREIVLDAIDDERGKNLIIATHHPMRSHGPHGGATTVRDHLFPLTTFAQPLYVPLPGLGSVITGIHKSGLRKQDLANADNRELQRLLIGAASDHGDVIFAAGHEQSLQYIRHRDLPFLISGSAAAATPTVDRPDAPYTHGARGFSRLDVFADGSARVEFWIVAADGTATRSFRSHIKDALPPPQPPAVQQDFPEYDARMDSSLQFPVTFPVTDKGAFGTAMLGEHHREVYLERTNFPVLDLSTFAGGLTPLKKGGGKQTHSLRLRDSLGREWVLRSLTKDLKTIPYPFNQLNLVNFLFKENFLAINPFMSLAIAPLAESAGVYHANPGIYYVPLQPALGGFNGAFGEQIYLLEERASEDRSDLASFANADKFVSTPKLVEKMRDNHKHRPDQRWTARSRLFDLLIGDFDRHDDQWRWARVENTDDRKLYRPIPRDRDQAFSRYDGFILKITRPYNNLLRQVTDYERGIPDYAWATYNTRFFDHEFLNELTLDDFLAEAAHLQTHLTDDAIAAAFAHLPPNIQRISSERLMRELRRRRDDLPNLARAFYLQLSERVVIHGADLREQYDIIRYADGRTEVNVYDLDKDNERAERLYHRVFHPEETREILVYGLGAKDIFHFTGTADRGSIRVRAVGGEGRDTYRDDTELRGGGRPNFVYDSRTGNDLARGASVRDKTSHIAAQNTYDRLGGHLDRALFTPYPLAGFNADDGFLLGARATLLLPRFKKAPYGQFHAAALTYAFATGGIDLTTEHQFVRAAGQWDVVANTNLRNDRYAFNFFGIGNDADPSELAPIERSTLNFYRVRQNRAYVDLGLRRRFAADLGTLTFGPLLEATSIEPTPNRFLTRDDSDVTAPELAARLYTGLRAQLEFESIDNPIHPRRGFHFALRAAYQTDLRGSNRRFGHYDAGLKLYKSTRGKLPVTFATYLGGGHAGEEADFFYLPTLGQRENIRGFFRERYRGSTQFFQLLDVRVPLGSWNNAILPFSFGITGSFDHGRVWSSGEDSDTWHSSYGGAVYLVPLNLAVVSVSYHVADDAVGLFRVKVGHAF